MTSASSDEAERRNDFDLVAPIYDGLATLVFAGAIKRAQLSMLPSLRGVDDVLILGGGTGWFLLALLRSVRPRRVLYIEKSSKMLRYSRELIAREAPDQLGCVEFRLGTEQSLEERDGSFQLIVTNFFLDLFNTENSAAVAESLARNFAPGGRWLFTDFQLPERGFLRWYAQLLFKVMFTFFNVFSRMESRRPPDWERIFGRIGMKIDSGRSFYGSMIHSRLLVRA
ncbi:MAG: class I SAM-dependent methyltransferase [Polyangiales bacterium]